MKVCISRRSPMAGSIINKMNTWQVLFCRTLGYLRSALAFLTTKVNSNFTEKCLSTSLVLRCISTTDFSQSQSDSMSVTRRVMCPIIWTFSPSARPNFLARALDRQLSAREPSENYQLIGHGNWVRLYLVLKSILGRFYFF